MHCGSGMTSLTWLSASRSLLHALWVSESGDDQSASRSLLHTLCVKESEDDQCNLACIQVLDAYTVDGSRNLGMTSLTWLRAPSPCSHCFWQEGNVLKEMRLAASSCHVVGRSPCLKLQFSTKLMSGEAKLILVLSLLLSSLSLIHI